MSLTEKQWTARAEAWLECAEHLELDWTDDSEEQRQGKIITKFCRTQSDACFAKSAEIICGDKLKMAKRRKQGKR